MKKLLVLTTILLTGLLSAKNVEIVKNENSIINNSIHVEQNKDSKYKVLAMLPHGLLVNFCGQIVCIWCEQPDNSDWIEKAIEYDDTHITNCDRFV